MLILVAVNAEVFPVASVGRVVQVVAVPMMNGEKAAVGPAELAAAPCAGQAVNGQRPLPVILASRLFIGLLEIPDDILGGLPGAPCPADAGGNAPPFASEADLSHATPIPGEKIESDPAKFELTITRGSL